MPLQDDCDVVRALGYLAMYGAHVDDRIGELGDYAQLHMHLSQKFIWLRPKKKALTLMAALRSGGFTKPVDDWKLTQKVLGHAILCIDWRNDYIHSVMIADPATGEVTDKSSDTRIDSSDVYDVANEAGGLLGPLYGLRRFSLPRLLNKVP